MGNSYTETRIKRKSGKVFTKHLLTFRIKYGFMAESVIPITSDGKITIPKELREKFDLKDYVKIEETLCDKGILIKKHD